MDRKKKMLFAMAGMSVSAGESVRANITVSPLSAAIYAGGYITLTAHAVNVLVIEWQEEINGVWTTIEGESGETFTRFYPYHGESVGSYQFRAVGYGVRDTVISNVVPVEVAINLEIDLTGPIKNVSTETETIPPTITGPAKSVKTGYVFTPAPPTVSVTAAKTVKTGYVFTPVTTPPTVSVTGPAKSVKTGITFS